MTFLKSASSIAFAGLCLLSAEEQACGFVPTDSTSRRYDSDSSMLLGAALSRRALLAIGAGYISASPLAVRVSASETLSVEHPVGLGLPEMNDNIFVSAFGIDGRPLQLPTISKQLRFAGDIKKDPQTGRPVDFMPPPSNWEP
mmetsp:Transcript_12384/g.16252  ORF Transcript_12384/g.16252 Transcript_12384/m.16252 type:complete len:143 (+) Transcript_12384:43-471(+)